MEKKFSVTLENLEEIGFKKDFKRLWEFYLTYCEEGFKANTINVYQFLLKKVNERKKFNNFKNLEFEKFFYRRSHS